MEIILHLIFVRAARGLHGTRVYNTPVVWLRDAISVIYVHLYKIHRDSENLRNIVNISHSAHCLCW